VGIGQRDDERTRGRRRQADELGPLVALAHQRVERRDQPALGERGREQRQPRAVLLLVPAADHAVGRAGADDRSVRRQIRDQLGQIVRLVAVLGRAEEGDEVGRPLELGAAHPPRLLQGGRRVGKLREGAARAHPARIEGWCLPVATMTIRPLTISTRRIRPAWNVRPRWIVT